MEKLLVREMAFKYGIKDMLKRTMYPEIIQDIMKRNKWSFNELIENSMGFNLNEVEMRGEETAYKEVKNLVAVTNLVLEGMEEYEVEGWKELCEGVRSGDPNHFKEVFLPYVTNKLSITSKSSSVVTNDGKIIVSNRMVKKSNLNLFLASIHVSILGLNFHRIYLKKSIANMRIFKTAILNPYLDDNLILLITLAEYWEITMNDLMGWDYDPDEFIAVGLVIAPTDNIGKVAVRDYKGNSKEVEIDETTLKDIKERGLLREINRIGNELHIGKTALRNYGI